MSESATVIIHVLHLPVEEWFIFILKKTFVLILVPFVELKTGIIPTKSELPLNVTLTTSKKIFALQVDVHKTRKHFMQI